MRNQFHQPHFGRRLKTLSIGALVIRISPSKGWSNSKIRKMAQATEKAEATKATAVVALGGRDRGETKEDDHEPGDKDNQHWYRN